ncbi:Crp/Fnr family transcriptional regulator [Crocinitomicaceae bacterium]|nr:Crp/Fnr family transcriptional regulator [Crocinitomicaceae bacterium]
MTDNELLNETYGYLFSPELLNEILKFGTIRSVKTGDVLIEIGNNIEFMPLLIDGAIKVLREDENGDDLLLYFLEKGDTCAMSMTCCMGKTKSAIRAEAERDSRIVMIPVTKMSEWISDYQEWKAFVFDSYSNRLNEMIISIDSLAFMNMNERIHKYLKDKVTVNKELEIFVTHQEIANDLHTSRVVVSRILKRLEKEKRIVMSRNKIALKDF